MSENTSPKFYISRLRLQEKILSLFTWANCTLWLLSRIEGYSFKQRNGLKIQKLLVEIKAQT